MYLYLTQNTSCEEDETHVDRWIDEFEYAGPELWAKIKKNHYKIWTCSNVFVFISLQK